MDLKMINMKDFSQALTAARILTSTSHEENFLTIFKNLSISPPPQDDFEVSFDFPYQSSKETKESCTIMNGEHPLEPEIEEFLTSLSTDLECNQETTDPMDNNQHDMEEEDEKHGPNQEMDQ